MADKKTRLWSSILYPDSMPPDFGERIAKLHLPCFVSPLHEPDSDSEFKKHYHIFLIYDGPTSQKVVEQDLYDIAGKGFALPISVRSRSGYARYLCHLDEKDKPHYDVNSVFQFGGLDYLKEIERSDDKTQLVDDILDFIDKYNLTSFHYLCKLCRREHKDWYRLMLNNPSCLNFIKAYMISLDYDLSPKHLE